MKRIVMFGGGSGSRNINMALCQAGYAVTRVVPAWDSGGSSKALREALGMLAIGDIRQALMTMAHAEGRVGSVVRFFNSRLSEASNRADLLAEFEFYASGAHALLSSMDSGIRAAILTYLRVFRSKIDDSFDFRRGSIGNFVLTGAYLAHGRNINAAIFVFRELCAIEGNVWPSTFEDTAELRAELRDGSLVQGQDRITALQPERAQVGIRRVHLSAHAAAGAPTRPAPNPAVLEAIGAADAMLFGPGSFYSSTLPHLLVAGIAQAVSATPDHVCKVFIGNILECPETTGRTLAEALQALQDAAGGGLLTHVFANRSWVPFERVAKGFRYLANGLPEDSHEPLPNVIEDDFEDPWHRGRHDAPKVVATLARLLGGGASSP
jgi:CofD-related protein of GAK system